MLSGNTGSSILDGLSLVSGSTYVTGTTIGNVQNLPAGSQQLTASGYYGYQQPQVAPPINWMPILLVSGFLITLAMLYSRGRK